MDLKDSCARLIFLSTDFKGLKGLLRQMGLVLRTYLLVYGL